MQAERYAKQCAEIMSIATVALDRDTVTKCQQAQLAEMQLLKAESKEDVLNKTISMTQKIPHMDKFHRTSSNKGLALLAEEVQLVNTRAGARPSTRSRNDNDMKSRTGSCKKRNAATNQ